MSKQLAILLARWYDFSRMGKKILITGIYSRLGRRLKETLLKKNLTPIGIERIKKEKSVFQADITELSQLLPIFEKEKPEIVIHAAAMTDVDGCEIEKDAAWKINVLGTENVAKAAQIGKARMIYISTDYVFDGNSGPYSEDANPNPINHYGLTKLEGEKRAQKFCEDALILRTCVPYDWNDHAAPNFLMWLVEKLKKNEKLKIAQDQFNTPTFIPHLAECIADFCQKNTKGVVHCSGKEFISRYDFAKKVCSIFGCSPLLIEPCLSSELKQIAQRPLKAGLIVEKAEQILEKKMLPLEEGLKCAHQLYLVRNIL